MFNYENNLSENSRHLRILLNSKKNSKQYINIEKNNRALISTGSVSC